MNLSKSAKCTRVSNAEAAAQTAINSSTIDMTGFDAVEFIVQFGTISAGSVVNAKLQESADDSTWADLLGSAITVADTRDNDVAILDCTTPQKRYIRCTITRTTADAVVDSVIALQYRAKTQPVVHDATTVAGSEHHLSPIAGTA